MNKDIKSMSKDEMRNYIFELQKFIQIEKDNGKDIDTILDETNIFDEFENLLPDNEFPIFVITILNGFKSDFILENIINTLDESINRL